MSNLKKKYLGDNKTIKILFGNGYYDGVRSGMMIMNEEKYCFSEKKETAKNITLYVHPVTKFQKFVIESQHRLFQKYVGLHCDYDQETGIPLNYNQKLDYDLYIKINRDWEEFIGYRKIKDEIERKKIGWIYRTDLFKNFKKE